MRLSFAIMQLRHLRQVPTMDLIEKVRCQVPNQSIKKLHKGVARSKNIGGRKPNDRKMVTQENNQKRQRLKLTDGGQAM